MIIMAKGEHSFCADDKATHRFDAIIVVTQRGACNRVTVSFAGKSTSDVTTMRSRRDTCPPCRGCTLSTRRSAYCLYLGAFIYVENVCGGCWRG